MMEKTQNLYYRPMMVKTPYELLNRRKPNIAYFSINLKRLSGVLREPRIIHDFRAGSRYRVIAVLQHLFKYLYRVKTAEVLQ